MLQIPRGIIFLVISGLLVLPETPASALTFSDSSGNCQSNITGTGVTSSSAEMTLATISSVDYCVIKFKDAKSYQWTTPSFVTSIDILLIGGGGRGGRGSSSGWEAGGGGAGGYIETSTTLLSSTSYDITVGLGASTSQATATTSTLSKSATPIYSALAGGNGGDAANASSGGSGGGSSHTFSGGVATNTLQGKNGAGISGGMNGVGGGGGGAGGAGGVGTSRCNGGTGGLGKSSSITGAPIFYAGGGGGSRNSSPCVAGSGGSSIGGTGALTVNDLTTGAATAGATNTGSGGGGGLSSNNTTNYGAGGSGVVIIRYQMVIVPTTSSLNSFSLPGSATAATYRSAITVTAIVSVQAKVTFKSNGTVIPGCKNKLATGSASTYTATCNWKPSRRGDVLLTASATPTNLSTAGSMATPIRVRVINRTGSR